MDKDSVDAAQHERVQRKVFRRDMAHRHSTHAADRHCAEARQERRIGADDKDQEPIRFNGFDAGALLEQHSPIFDQTQRAIARESSGKRLQHHTLPRTARQIDSAAEHRLVLPSRKTPLQHTLNIAPIVCNVNRNRKPFTQSIRTGITGAQRHGQSRRLFLRRDRHDRQYAQQGNQDSTQI